MAKWQRPRPCWCQGYWFPHRLGGGSCFHAPELQSRIVRARREGLDVLQVVADWAWDVEGVLTGGECPF